MPKRDSLPTAWKRPPHTGPKYDILTRYPSALFGILD